MSFRRRSLLDCFRLARGSNPLGRDLKGFPWFPFARLAAWRVASLTAAASPVDATILVRLLVECIARLIRLHAAQKQPGPFCTQVEARGGSVTVTPGSTQIPWQ